MQHPKIVIVGAGSLFFGRKAIWQAVHSPVLRHGTLALVDTDETRLNKMAALARKVIDHHDAPLAFEASTDRRQVLRDADFVVLSFAYRNAHFRGVDCRLSEKYGVRMCSGDTIGPGGVFRTLRELPEIFRVCDDVRELCPDAWVINYINPTAVNGIALRRSYPDLKSFALCDAQWALRDNMARRAGVPNDEKLVLQSAGPNHFTWLLRAEYDGENLLPRLIDAIASEADADFNQQAQGGKTQSKGYLNNAIAIELYHTLGALATVLGHTKEYVRFYQGHHKIAGAIPPLKLFDVPARVEWTDSIWRRVDEYLSEQAPIGAFDDEFGPDPATDVIESMAGGLGKRFFINTFNRGAVRNMADDAFLEMYCDLDMNGPRPLAIGEMPRGVRAMCETVLDAHELTAQAVREQRLDLVRRAMLVDPLANSVADTDALIRDLVEAEQEILPQWLTDTVLTTA